MFSLYLILNYSILIAGTPLILLILILFSNIFITFSSIISSILFICSFVNSSFGKDFQFGFYYIFIDMKLTSNDIFKSSINKELYLFFSCFCCISIILIKGFFNFKMSFIQI